MDHDKKSTQSIISRNRKIEKVLNKSYKDLSKRFTTVKGKRFTKVLKKEINALRTSLKTNIEQEVKQQWALANKKTDIMTDGYLQNVKVSDQLYKSFRTPNLGALNTFLNRVEKGMNLSKRVWNLTSNAQIQIEEFLASGITVGKPAVLVSKELQRFMVGKGVQYKGTLLKARNITWEAFRLATTEANMAFRLAEEVKMQKLPFVTGCSIHLSGAHPRIDICDELEGDYPKGFIWGGWHPICICFRVWKKINRKDFVKFMKTRQIAKGQFITKVSPNMTKFMKTNAEKLGGYVQRGTEPYWIRDNFAKDLSLKSSVSEIRIPGMELIAPKVPKAPRIMTRGHLSEDMTVRELNDQIILDAKRAGVDLRGEMANDIRESVRSYTSKAYGRIRSFQTGGPDGLIKEWTDNIEKLLDFSPKFKGRTLYRGINLASADFQYWEGMTKGKVIDMRGMSSWTTSSAHSSLKGSNVVITLAKNKTGVSIRHLSVYEFEEEVLFSVKARFVIQSVKMQKGRLFIDVIEKTIKR